MIDSHCHLADGALASDIEGVISRAVSAGVDRMVCCGTSPGDWAAVERLSARYAEVRAAYGLHPWYVAEAEGVPDVESALRQRLETDSSAGVGEIGLDRACAVDVGLQRDYFMMQMRLAVELGRAVSIHCVRAWGILTECLDELGRLPPGIVLHGYSGSAEMVGQLEKRGCLFSFSAAVLRGGAKRRQAVRAVPAERLLLESDAPFGGPEGKPNEPADLLLAAEGVAVARGVSVREIASITAQNALRLPWFAA